MDDDLKQEKIDIKLRIEGLALQLLRNENDIVQATYGAELALKTKEYTHVLRCAKRLIEYDMCNQEIVKQLKELREKVSSSEDDDSGSIIF